MFRIGEGKLNCLSSAGNIPIPVSDVCDHERDLTIPARTFSPDGSPHERDQDKLSFPGDYNSGR